MLSHALENPANFGRWRLLEGKTPGGENCMLSLMTDCLRADLQVGNNACSFRKLIV